MPIALKSIMAGAMTAALPLTFLTPATPAAASTCTGRHLVQTVSGYEGLYAESSEDPLRPTCSVVTNTASDGTVLLIRSSDGLIEPVVPSDDGLSTWVAGSARQAAQDLATGRGTVLLPNESVILHYSRTNSFTVSIADNQINATSKLAGSIASYAVSKALSTGAPWFGRVENRVFLKKNIEACAQGAGEAWKQTNANQPFPDLAHVLEDTALETFGPCKTAFQTIKDFDTRAPDSHSSPAWQQTLDEAENFDGPAWKAAWLKFKTMPLRQLILRVVQ
ncbi:hypothetical protein [Streptomyces europaeiscabiei]|uniref:hypothetical protein n=1 Tax=Streptomyces europaeiscabiei TaxID=146819 RepID=UPI0038F634B4